MAKDPAFLFYPNDYLGGTMGMTFEEKGAYIELLMLQFNRGHMTSHMIGQTVGQLWDNIKDKFIKDEHGLYYNVRLDEEKNKRKRFTESRRNNIKGVNQYTKKSNKKIGHKSGHMTSHMENENENENINKDKSINKEEFSDFEFNDIEIKLHTIETFLNRKIWLESIERNLKLREGKAEEYFKIFFEEIRNKGELTKKTELDISSHFFNWLKMQSEKNQDLKIRKKTVLKSIIPEE